MTELEVELEVEDHPDPEAVRGLVAALVADNATRVAPEEWWPVATVLRRRGQMVGGVSGHTHWGWLFVGHLWVAPEDRRSGLGRRLMTSIEERALGRGCRSAWLDTYSFQAREFYERLGYRAFGRLDGYPTGQHRLFLRKDLR